MKFIAVFIAGIVSGLGLAYLIVEAALSLGGEEE